MSRRLLLLIEWVKIHLALGVLPDLFEFRRVIVAYSEPHRVYHKVEHIVECLMFLKLYINSTGRRLFSFDNGKHKATIKLALFYHDLVYDPNQRDNESQSADRFEEYAAGKFDTDTRIEICRLIRLTAGHKPEINDRSGEIMNDCDMAVLGKKIEHYLEYAKGVAKEYCGVIGRDAYLSGRIAFLSNLDPDTIFYSLDVREVLTAQARTNIAYELLLLEKEPQQILGA